MIKGIIAVLTLSILMTAPSASADQTNSPQVIIDTTQGKITLELYPDKAPETVKNFLSYVDEGFFDGTIFHRVINGFMIQGGGFTPDMEQKQTKAAIKIESNNGLKNTKGTVAMARTNDPNSATAQFFINHKDNDFLNFKDESVQGYGYAVFGKVTEGLDVVDKIASVKTTTKGYFQDVPVETVEIKSVKRK